MKAIKNFTLLLILALIIFVGCTPVKNEKLNFQFFTKLNSNVKSEWVFLDRKGVLVYKTNPRGDKIMDFSHAGYMGGGVAIPDVPVKKVVYPSNSIDDTKNIQLAIDEVSALHMINGIRGAVQLAEGDFICSGSLYLHTDGVVIKGSGCGANGTTIRMVGDRHVAFVVGGRQKQQQKQTAHQEKKSKDDEFSTFFSNRYVPSGSTSFEVIDVKGFNVGDIIEIKKPITEKWVRFMEMDNLIRDGKKQTWIGNNSFLRLKRKITSINGNIVSIDIPLSDSFDPEHLNPPGISVIKAKAQGKAANIGIENFRVSCPPLEIAYGNAPYSGVRIIADDCWIRNVVFEETMNTITIAGDRNTFQNIEIKHTYTNLGASKPTDFNIEGSQNLLDRCYVTGGNTYFVWTSGLNPGPNVLLNCTFRGHGSRIQPHMRWSTGLLVDNCTVADGGIDFMNRGVAGSGHGWTMGWGVAWNCIAENYIIQNPPGANNWAIGCIGEKINIPRFFDAEPNLPEGIFNSHGKPVNPQSLYLAQLAERLGEQSLQNIGYSSNSKEMFLNKKVEKLPAQKIKIDPEFGVDLAMFRPVNTNNTRDKLREFSGENAVDGDLSTFWMTDDNLNSHSLIIDMEGLVNINGIELAEASGYQNHVLRFKIEGQVDSDWIKLSEGNTIGDLKIQTFKTTPVWKVRLTILETNSTPAISKISLYYKE